jgi:hypothetical protein
MKLIQLSKQTREHVYAEWVSNTKMGLVTVYGAGMIALPVTAPMKVMAMSADEQAAKKKLSLWRGQRKMKSARKSKD